MDGVETKPRAAGLEGLASDAARRATRAAEDVVAGAFGRDRADLGKPAAAEAPKDGAGKAEGAGDDAQPTPEAPEALIDQALKDGQAKADGFLERLRDLLPAQLDALLQ